MPSRRRAALRASAVVLMRAIPIAAVIALASRDASATPIKVACVGEQTTHSDQLNRNVEYPAALQRMLGACTDVQNFGDCCATVLQGYPTQSETHPYLDPPAGKYIPSFHESLAFAPDVVVIGSWGKHDTEIANSVYSGTLDPVKFQADYDQLVTTYLNLPNKPTVYVSTPLPLPSGQPMGVTTTVILPVIQSIAAKYHLAMVPLYDRFLNQPQLYKDATHPTDVEGLQTIADAVYETITGGAMPALDAGCGGGLIVPGGADGSATGASSGAAGASGTDAGIGPPDGSSDDILDGGMPAAPSGADAGGAAASANAGDAGQSEGHAPGCACDAASRSGGPGGGWLAGALVCLLMRRHKFARS